MSVRPFLDQRPKLGERVYVDPAGCVIGEVTLGDDVSIWPMAVVRGDVNHIVIGARTNVQDAAVVHVTHEGPFTRPGGWADGDRRRCHESATAPSSTPARWRICA